jgi:nitroreductase
VGETELGEPLGRLREFDLRVLDHLDEVAPGVAEVVSTAEELDSRLSQRLERGLSVLDDEPEVPLVVGRLRAALGEREELVAHVEKGHVPVAFGHLEVEEAAVELDRLVEVAHLERDVVDAHEPGSRGHGGTVPPVDTFLAIASRREVRDYADRPIPKDVEERILDAGRLSGSSQNRQNWHFVVVEDEELRRQVADAVYAPENVLGAAVVVVIAVFGKGPTSFDAGRAAQNMLLAAWNDGVGGCPNGVKDADETAALLRFEEDERPAIVLSFGYPARARDPESRPAEEWSSRAKRKPLDELVRRL